MGENDLPAGRFYRTFRQEISKNLQGIGAHGVNDADEFDDVDTPLAALVFGYKRLRFAKSLRKRLLPHARLMSHCDKKLN